MRWDRCSSSFGIRAPSGVGKNSTARSTSARSSASFRTGSKGVSSGEAFAVRRRAFLCSEDSDWADSPDVDRFGGGVAARSTVPQRGFASRQ
eukprot:CAMPEP_0113321354 /NCGR_PEP_ID=MMETSP0010_2-20120614/14870_1 /TAXON_ID=216773 ORGANISM="Corethron hystrix, Strain 308" /NCGR_SAMPLE_ID=MMETSP0010_2 /ASSEMBLY_ACC=CAM_ASM_000155 /LENGTH=91 /DNA_ID=CAMNT_0000179467 /DNA_START=638 /DNA_END=913 /DNA_ORIENTATION=- /assembly_acc=CAM_ASM_000155